MKIVTKHKPHGVPKLASDWLTKIITKYKPHGLEYPCFFLIFFDCLTKIKTKKKLPGTNQNRPFSVCSKGVDAHIGIKKFKNGLLSTSLP